MTRVLAFVAIAAVLLLRATAVRAQLVFREGSGIPGLRCESSMRILADAKTSEWAVTHVKHWASGFSDGAHAALETRPVRSSADFTYARLQNYCGQYPNATLQEAMLALVAEDQSANSTNNTPATSEPPQVVFRPPVVGFNPPTWVLWSYSTEWRISTADSVNFPSKPSKVSVNLSYFESRADCTTVGSWLAGLPKGPAVSGLNISFQCFPITFNPRDKKK